MIDSLQFSPEILAKKPTSGLDVETTLSHFAILTYLVEVEDLRPHIHQRFELDCITLPNGSRKALVSVVPFLDLDFRFVQFPWLKWTFAQTNYRAYVTDMETGQHVVWFFGTSLDSWTVSIPRWAWQLPWHRANIRFDTQYDNQQQAYTNYQMVTHSQWAGANLELSDTGRPPKQLLGFPNLESGLVLLTHPLRGYFYRRDGKLGSYSIWHDQLQPTEGHVKEANFPLLHRLGLVEESDLSAIHSVLIQPKTDFTIYLPPVRVLDTYR